MRIDHAVAHNKVRTPAMDDLEKEVRAWLKDHEFYNDRNPDKFELEGVALLTRCLEAIAWKSVEDGLPEKFEWVLIKIKYGDSPAVASLDKDSDWFVDTEHVNCDGGWDGCTTHSDIENGQVTHWKPITPKGGD